MAVTQDTDHFNIPVITFLAQLAKERFPDLNLSEGSVLYDTVIRPFALISQPQTDFMRVMHRNMALRNFQVMDERELDSLASNFLVTRREGVKARGVQRVFFSRAQPTSIGSSARFYDDQGHTFRPLNPVSATQSEMMANVLSSTGEYYVDVPVIAALAGEDSIADAGTVRNFQGIPGATRTTNDSSYGFGKNRDSNTELYSRIVGSLTNRDLVKKTAIEKAILDNFDSVRQVEVVGFGDSAMNRDVTSALLATQELFRKSFCYKVNLPLDGNGDVKFVEDDGTTVVVTPIGGYVGAIYDTLDLDYLNLTVTFDGQVYEQLAVQPGFTLRLFGVDDPDIGDYVVKRVMYVPVEPGGENVRVLVFDRAFSSLSESGDAIDRFPYTLLGTASSSRFHVGGKIDVYIDSAADVTKTVTIGQTVSTEDGVYELPLLDTVTQNGVSVFENGVGFESPVLAVLKIEELDQTSSNVVVRTLIPDTHYVVVRKEKRGLYAQADSDVLIIRGKDESGSFLFDGSRLKITYTTNPDYLAIQSYLDLNENRDITKNILVQKPEIVLIDVDLAYKGTISVSDVRSIIAEFLLDKSFLPEITVNEIVSLLAFFGVTDISMPVTLISRFDKGNGEIESKSSEDRLTGTRVQLFRAVADLNVRKIG